MVNATATDYAIGRNRRTKRSTATREQIVAAAAEALATRGYQGASLEAIAERAGVTIGTVYYHFASKEDLFWAVVGPLTVAGTDSVEDIVKRGMAPRQTIVAVVTAAVAGVQDPKRRYLYYQEMLPLDGEMRRFCRERERRYETLVAEVIARGQATGEIRAGDPQVLSLILIGAIARTARWYDPQGRVPGKAFATALCDVLLRGLFTG